ncbi:hypothetical protein A2U01_0059235, partial [Trifolium medium]|nr:hypothetical protein [Trifolium medium]
RMRTIFNEDRLKFLAKARQKKTEPAAETLDPLSQLAVEEETTKGKRKKRTKTGRISIPVPNKGEGSAAGGSTDELGQPSPKKRKGLVHRKGHQMALT